MPPSQDKGKGKARARDGDGEEEEVNNSSHFQPERPQQGPRVGSSNSRQSQDQAKMRLVRSRSISSNAHQSHTSTNNGTMAANDDHAEQQPEDQVSSTPTLSQQSSNTIRSPTIPPIPSSQPTASSRDFERAGSIMSTSSDTLQRLGSNDGGSGGTYYYQSIIQRQPKLRIREDVTKHTSFDRAIDGTELYDLWVG